MHHVKEAVHVPVHRVSPLLGCELADVRLVDVSSGGVHDGVDLPVGGSDFVRRVRSPTVELDDQRIPLGIICGVDLVS